MTKCVGRVDAQYVSAQDPEGTQAQLQVLIETDLCLSRASNAGGKRQRVEWGQGEGVGGGGGAGHTRKLQLLTVCHELQHLRLRAQTIVQWIDVAFILHQK